MKSLVLTLTVLFATSAQATSFQTHEEHAIQKFNNSVGVQALLAEAKKTGVDVEDSKALLLNGQCGFAGCSRTYLVSKVVERRGTNATTDSINAIVTIPAIGEAKVSPVFDSGMLLEGIKALNQ